jgi:ribosomal protein S18 acetylase RimI-like enzyme
MIRLPDVIDTFARGFAAWRSRTHPYIVGKIGPVWVVRDGPRKANTPERNREYVAFDTPPDIVVQHIKSDKPKGYALCVVHSGMERDAGIESAYKALGFRYASSEPFFVCQIPPVPRGRGPLPVRRVTRLQEARAIAKAARSRQINEADLADNGAAWRLFAAFDGDIPIGWVSSIRTAPTRAWVANLHVAPAYRGKGVGSSLMRMLLRDDAGRDIRFSVLSASKAGSVVYRRVGYEQVGLLQLFRPMRSGKQRDMITP